MESLSHVVLRVDLTPHQALALAQFVKRITYSEIAANAVSVAEADVMRDCVDLVRRGLADVGYAPR